MLNQNLKDIKVLFLGNNDESTDHDVSSLALAHGTKNYGLITQSDFMPETPGFYHTTVTDIPGGKLINLAKRFNTVVMLDQPQDRWSHWKCLQATCKLMLKLEESGHSTVFRDNDNVKRFVYWHDLVFKKNKSFCIYPWINFHNNGTDLKLCSRDKGIVTSTDKLQNWKNDPDYNRIRRDMLEGNQLPEHCQACYQYEEKGLESYRQFETIDWVTSLELNSIDDLDQIEYPYFYEVHNGNNCNIKCRSCQPAFSEPIGRELKKFNIITPTKFNWEPNTWSLDNIDIDTLNHKSSIYFQGGEPTIMPEVRNFLEQCIEKKRTDFFLTMCTNGVKISDEFLEIMGHFSQTNFSISIDGYEKVNDYWRWGSKWEKVIDNTRRLQNLGHSISINTVPGIYNVTNMHLLFEFLDREFPFSTIYMQINYIPWQSAYGNPLRDLVIDSMQKCMQTSIYHSNGKSCKTAVDSIYAYYSDNFVCDLGHLKSFFDYNDQLDRARNVKLADYIPELEMAREYIRH